MHIVRTDEIRQSCTPEGERRTQPAAAHRLRTFGGLAVEGPDGPLAGRIAHRHPLALLALLAARCDGRCTRDKVIGYLWGESDEQRARHALADTLYIVRRTLGTEAVRSVGSSLQLDTDRLSSDIGAFDAALERGDLDGAVALYEGAFLDGFHLPDASEFEQWLDTKRQHYERRYGDALVALAENAESRGDPDGAIARWRQAAEHRPYDAQVALRLSEALTAVGDRAEAFRALLDYESRLQRDLGIEPDGAVKAVKESLASAAHDAACDPGSVPNGRPHPHAAFPIPQLPTPPLSGADGSAPPTPRPRRSPVGAAVGLGAVGLVLAVAAIDLFQPASPRTLDPDQIVVPGFDRVSQAVDTLTASGLARLVSLTLDGAGPLRSIPAPRASAGEWRPGDRGAARRLAGATGAGLVLFAHLAPFGRDSLSASVVLYDAIDGHRLATLQAHGDPDDLQSFADRIAVAVMEELASRRQFGAWRLSSVGSRSPAAVREFLRAEWHLRHFQLDSARWYYRHAIRADTGFALAYRGLDEVESWQRHLLEFQPALALRAGELNHGLALRESLLLTTDSLFGAITTYGTLTPPPALLRRLLLTVSDWTEAYPRDPEAWYRLGDIGYHFEGLAGMTYVEAREALARAIEIDSGYAPPYAHKIELDLALEGPPAALETTYAVLALRPEEPWLRALEIAAVLLDADRASSPDAAEALNDVAVAAQPRYLPRDPPTFSLLVANHLLMWSVAPGEPGLRVARAWRYPNAVAVAAAYRGHLAEAYAALTGDESEWMIPGSSRNALFAALARLGAVPHDTATRAAQGWLDAGDGWSVYNALRWWGEMGDTLSLARAEALFGSLARDSLAGRRALGVYGRRAAGAYAALARGDTTAAVAQLTALTPWCRIPECHSERLTLARILVRLGRDREALSQYVRTCGPLALPPSPEAVLVAYERGQIEERLQQHVAAVQSYRYVVEAWRDADPRLGRFVDGARAGLRRLASGRQAPLP